MARIKQSLREPILQGLVDQKPHAERSSGIVR